MLSRASPGLLFVAALCCVLVHGQVDVPSPSNFVRLSEHSATVLGDYAYIDGGEISQLVNREIVPNYGGLRMNSTLTIPLNESWTPPTLSIQASQKGSYVPKLVGSSLWADAAANRLIIFGGDNASEYNSEVYYNVSHTSLWVFTPDGSGGGKWGNLEVPDASWIGRRAFGASVVCAGAALQLGGYGHISTDAIYPPGDGIPVAGLVSYNLSLSSGPRSWSNTSGAAFIENYVRGESTCLPSYGQAGLAVFMGGMSTSYDYSGYGNIVSFYNLTFYDPRSGRWYWQTTNGPLPPPRLSSCVVAVQGQNGTTEIFVYGGYDTERDISLSDVWVLTIPGFQWFQGKSSGVGTERNGHQCVVGGKGNRQMISIGGLNTNENTGGWNEQDPWASGVGVLDLPSMTWQNVYNATAAAYDSPQVVKDWYSSGNLESVSWSRSSVKSLFMAGYTPHNTTTSTTGNAGKTNTGAIAGGVVGGVVGVTLAAGLVYYLMRVRQKRHLGGAVGSTPNAEYHGKAEHNAEGPKKWPPPNELPPPDELPPPYSPRAVC